MELMTTLDLLPLRSLVSPADDARVGTAYDGLKTCPLCVSCFGTIDVIEIRG